MAIDRVRPLVFKESDFVIPSSLKTIPNCTKEVLKKTGPTNTINFKTFDDALIRVIAKTKTGNWRTFTDLGQLTAARERMFQNFFVKNVNQITFHAGKSPLSERTPINWSMLYPLALLGLAKFLPTGNALQLNYTTTSPALMNTPAGVGQYRSCDVSLFNEGAGVIWDNNNKIWQSWMPYGGTPSAQSQVTTQVGVQEGEVKSIQYGNSSYNFWTNTDASGRKLNYLRLDSNYQPMGSIKTISLPNNPRHFDCSVLMTPEGQLKALFINRTQHQKWEGYEVDIDPETGEAMGDPKKIQDFGMNQQKPSGLYFEDGSRATFLTIDGGLYQKSYDASGAERNLTQLLPQPVAPLQYQYPKPCLLPEERGYVVGCATVDIQSLNMIKGYKLLRFNNDGTFKNPPVVNITSSDMGTTNMFGSTIEVVPNPRGADVIFRMGGELKKISLDEDGLPSGNISSFGAGTNISAFSIKKSASPPTQNTNEIYTCFTTPTSVYLQKSTAFVPPKPTPSPTSSPTPFPTPAATIELGTTGFETATGWEETTTGGTSTSEGDTTGEETSGFETTTDGEEIATGDGSTTGDPFETTTGWGSSAGTTGIQTTTGEQTTGSGMTTSGTTGFPPTETQQPTPPPVPAPTPDPATSTPSIPISIIPISDPKGPSNLLKRIPFLIPLIAFFILCCNVTIGFIIYWCMRRRKKQRVERLIDKVYEGEKPLDQSQQYDFKEANPNSDFKVSLGKGTRIRSFVDESGLSKNPLERVQAQKNVPQWWSDLKDSFEDPKKSDYEERLLPKGHKVNKVEAKKKKQHEIQKKSLSDPGPYVPTWLPENWKKQKSQTFYQEPAAEKKLQEEDDDEMLRPAALKETSSKSSMEQEIFSVPSASDIEAYYRNAKPKEFFQVFKDLRQLGYSEKNLPDARVLKEVDQKIGQLKKAAEESLTNSSFETMEFIFKEIGTLRGKIKDPELKNSFTDLDKLMDEIQKSQKKQPVQVVESFGDVFDSRRDPVPDETTEINRIVFGEELDPETDISEFAKKSRIQREQGFVSSMSILPSVSETEEKRISTVPSTSSFEKFFDTKPEEFFDEFKKLREQGFDESNLPDSSVYKEIDQKINQLKRAASSLTRPSFVEIEKVFHELSTLRGKLQKTELKNSYTELDQLIEKIQKFDDKKAKETVLKDNPENQPFDKTTRSGSNLIRRTPSKLPSDDEKEVVTANKETKDIQTAVLVKKKTKKTKKTHKN